jgi:hypothetical protein
VSLGGLKIEQVANGTTKMRILCVGLGGGSLPLFLAHNLPGATVEVVEIDHTVIEAATEAMGFPPCYGGPLPKCHQIGKQSSTPQVTAAQSVHSGHMYSNGQPFSGETNSISKQESLLHPNSGASCTGSKIGIDHGVRNKTGNSVLPGLSCSQRGPDPHEEVLWGSTLRNMVVYEGDGEDFVLNHGMGQISGYYDMVFVDAYDGHDTVPLKLWCREGPFLTALSNLLHPHHGTVVVSNMTECFGALILKNSW